MPEVLFSSLLSRVFSGDTKCGMRHKAQPVFGYQFPSDSVNAICLVFYPDKGGFKRLDELVFALRLLYQVLTLYHLRSFFKYMICGSCVSVRVITFVA